MFRSGAGVQNPKTTMCDNQLFMNLVKARDKCWHYARIGQSSGYLTCMKSHLPAGVDLKNIQCNPDLNLQPICKNLMNTDYTVFDNYKTELERNYKMKKDKIEARIYELTRAIPVGQTPPTEAEKIKNRQELATLQTDRDNNKQAYETNMTNLRHERGLVDGVCLSKIVSKEKYDNVRSTILKAEVDKICIDKLKSNTKICTDKLESNTKKYKDKLESNTKKYKDKLSVQKKSYLKQVNMRNIIIGIICVLCVGIIIYTMTN